jgi:hypothetical protein
MKLKKGDRFRNYIGELCFICYMYKDVVKLSYIAKTPWIEVYDKNEFISDVDNNRFFPEPNIKITRLNIAEHLVEYQLNMIGKTTEEAKKDDMWYLNWTFTQRQYDLFRGYAIPLIKKVFKCNTKKAEETFSWFNLQFGLRLKD